MVSVGDRFFLFPDFLERDEHVKQKIAGTVIALYPLGKFAFVKFDSGVRECFSIAELEEAERAPKKGANYD